MIGELWRQEAIKLLSQKYPYLLMAVTVLLPVVRMLVLALTPPRSSLDVVSGPQLWAEGMEWSLRVMVFVVLVIGAMAFSREFSLGTARTVLMLPVSRTAWLTAKLLWVAALTWSLLLACCALYAAIVAATVGWGDVAREGLVIYAAGTFWWHISLSIGLTAVFLLPVCAFALVLGLHFNSSGAAVGVAVLLGIVLESVSGLLDAGRYVFLFHLHRPVALVGKLGRGLPFTWETELTLGLATTLTWFALLMLWGWMRLVRMDITT